MLIMITVFMLLLLFGIIGAGLRLAWGMTKFIFGLGLFWVCPLLFIIAVLSGGFTTMWLPIVIVGLLFGRGFRRIV